MRRRLVGRSNPFVMGCKIMSTGTSKTALAAARIALLTGVSAAALLAVHHRPMQPSACCNGPVPNNGALLPAPLLACGPNARASGDQSTAVGGGSTALRPLASGDFSTAVGRDAQATNTSSLAAANGATASGISSVALGGDANSTLNAGALASGTSSIAIGGRSDATIFPFVPGSAATASNTGDIAIGGGVGTTNGARVLGTNRKQSIRHRNWYRLDSLR